jgi:hypothetical protein
MPDHFPGYHPETIVRKYVSISYQTNPNDTSKKIPDDGLSHKRNVVPQIVSSLIHKFSKRKPNFIDKRFVQFADHVLNLQVPRPLTAR